MFGEPRAVPGRICCKRCPEPLKEEFVVRAGAGRRAGYANSFYLFRMERAPVQRLLTAHRPAVNKSDALDTEDFSKQPFLRVNIVQMRKCGGATMREWTP